MEVVKIKVFLGSSFQAFKQLSSVNAGVGKTDVKEFFASSSLITFRYLIVEYCEIKGLKRLFFCSVGP